MVKDERIHEFVLPECDDSYYKGIDKDEFSRCVCGSSILRIKYESILDKKGKEIGMEYYVFCAKCGNHVFGFTDKWEI